MWPTSTFKQRIKSCAFKELKDLLAKWHRELQKYTFTYQYSSWQTDCNYRVNFHSYNSSLFDPSEKIVNIKKKRLFRPTLLGMHYSKIKECLRSNNEIHTIHVCLLFHQCSKEDMKGSFLLHNVFVLGGILYGTEFILTTPPDNRSINMCNKLFNRKRW